MKLSELVFQCVKYGSYLDDTHFTYEAFKNGDYEDDVDYKGAIDKVWFSLNEAMHRLSVKDKIPNQLGEYEIDNNTIDLTNTIIDIRNVRNVFQFVNGEEMKVGHRRVGNMLILYGFRSNKKAFIEYKVDIPNFDIDDLVEDKDLKKEYGITETACSFIIEYVKSWLLEVVAPEMAYQHRTIAEQYFVDLDTYNNGFEQQKVQPIYKIGG